MTIQKGVISLLFADDDEDYHNLFSEVINETGVKIEVSMVVNGEQVMEFLANPANEIPSFIFLDNNMPLKTGKECVTEIRNDSRFDSIPLIMFSASTYYKDIEETFNAGANLYINKTVFFCDPVNIMKKIFTMDWKEYFLNPDMKKFVLRERWVSQL